MEHNISMKLRVGVNCGPVVAGIIGKSKYIYGLWGDTVNLASRMESGSVPDAVQVRRAVYEQLKHQFVFEPRGPIEVKGKGKEGSQYGGPQLSAACLEPATITIAVNAIALVLLGVANKCAHDATSHSADGRPAPAIADNAANDCARACTDCGPSLCLRACRKEPNHSNRNDKLFHASIPLLDLNL
jgi:hypothetical protein